MLVKKEQWGQIPLLHAMPDHGGEGALPTVVFFHGFTSAKEHNLHYAYNLTEKGFRVLLPDAHLHGEREQPLDVIQLSLRFWEIVLTNIEELKLLHESLLEKGLADEDIACAGTSMGGITTMGALTIYPWIRTAAVMMGGAGFVDLASAQMAQFEAQGFELPINEEEREKMLATLAYFDMTKQPEKMAGRPVFFWHGQKDPTVPFEPTYRFFQEVQADYTAYPERLQFMYDKNAAHAVSREGMLASVDWLARHLGN